MIDIFNLIRYKDKHKILNIFITIFGAFLYAVGIKWFIIPAGQLTGGFTGIAQLVSDLGHYLFGFTLPVSMLWLVLNIPVFFLGFKGIGRRFTFLSMLSVAFGSIILEYIPVEIVTLDPMLCAIAGGVISGIGVGITLKFGASTGGMDIVSQYLSFKKDGSVGQYSFIINTCIVLIAGYTKGWTIALYTIVNLFISSVVIDKIHTRHNKLTLMIVTDFKDELTKAIHNRIYRGITIIPAQGGFTRKDKNVLFMVISSSELYNVTQIIKEVDASAFTNVLKSQYIFGNFFREKTE